MPGSSSFRSTLYPWLCVILGAFAQPTPPGALKIEVLEGEGAINSIAERRARDPVVKVTDDKDRAVSGVTVAFMTPNLGASAVFPSGYTITALTDENGIATGRGLRPNNIAGEFQIRLTASYRGLTATATIAQTNAAPTARRGGSGKAIAIIAIVGGGAAAGAAVALGGKRDSPTAPPTPQPTPRPATTVVPGSGNFGPP